MKQELLDDLKLNETDIAGALQRFSGDEALYLQLLIKFPEDQTMSELENAIDSHLWNEAFTAAHALKGLAGNMGFVPLFHETGELVMRIREGRIADLPESLKRVQSCYQDILSVIRRSQKTGG